MAALRAIEERDGKGNVVRRNASIVFKSAPEIRTVSGRHDYRLEKNPEYHLPITAQVQGKDILFFRGEPWTSQARAHAKQMTRAEVEKVAPYIIKNLEQNPIHVREERPMVYEVKLANIGGEEVPVAEELNLRPGTTEITVEPSVPARYVGDKAQAAAE